MKLVTKIVGVALIATALCGVGIGTASAATPVGSHGASTAAAATDAPMTIVMAYYTVIDPADSVNLPHFTCPTNHPWLVNMKLSPSQTVPNGVEIDGSGRIDVRIPAPTPGAGGRATGWMPGTATNYDTKYNAVTVSAFCTSSAADAYQV